MDRLTELRGEAGSSRDSTLDTTSPPSEAFMTANESSSKFYSLSEVDTTFDISSMKDDISSIKDVSMTTTTEGDGTLHAEELMSNLSPIGKKSDILDSYKIDTQIEAANILSGGVAIFDDNSYDGNELVIDDNVDMDEKSSPDLKQPDSLQFKPDENIVEAGLISEQTDIASKDTEVLLQIDGKNVDAIDIGNGLYLYRKEGQEELAAVQIIDDDQQQPSFKFLKVRENAEGNLEVYEEIEVEVPKEVPAKEGKVDRSTSSHVPIRDISKVISESNCNRGTEKQIKAPKKESPVNIELETENKEILLENKSEVNFNGKMMKLSESRKSPVIGSFTPMTYHSTPKKEGIPLTKTMVDQQLHPNRHSDLPNNKKTIEVHTDKKSIETPSRFKDVDDDHNVDELFPTNKEVDIGVCNIDSVELEKDEIKQSCETTLEPSSQNGKELNDNITKDVVEQNKIVSKDQHNSIDSAINTTTNNIETPELNQDIVNNKIVIEANVPEKDKVKELTKDAENPLKIEGEIDQTIVDTNLINKESETKYEENVLIDQKVSNKNEKEITEMPISEPILIEDDDVVTVVEEVVEQKDGNENLQNKSQVDAEVNESVEHSLKICDSIEMSTTDNKVTEEVIKKDKDIVVEKTLDPDPIITNSAVNSELNIETQSSAVCEQMPLNSSTSQSSYHERGTIALPDTKPENNTISCSAEKIDKAILQQENENLFEKPSIIDQNEICPIPQVAADIQNNKPILSLENKCTAKHFIAPNISPLLEQKQQSLLKSRVDIVKSGLPEKNIDKNTSPRVKDVTTIAKPSEQNVDGQLNSKNVPAKGSQMNESTPVIAQMQVYTSSAVPQGLIKSKNVNMVTSALEIRKNAIPLAIKNITVEKPRSALDIKASFTNQKDDSKIPPKANTREKGSCVMNIEISKVPKRESEKTSAGIKQSDHNTANKLTNQISKTKIESKDKKDTSKVTESKPINNNHAAVPFGKWTEANKQEFLNKFKIKTSVTSSNSNQLKNSNDLNRRDVLKKIDSQRQTASTALLKTQESNKHINKPEITAFMNKPNIIKESTQGSKMLEKTDITENKPKSVVPTNTTKVAAVSKLQNESQSAGTGVLSQKEVCQTKEKVQHLIDKTIEGMIHRNTQSSKPQNDAKPNPTKEPNLSKQVEKQKKIQNNQQPLCDAKLDEIEMKMNELHGIPFIERPPHELPQVYKAEPKAYSIIEKEKVPAPVKTKIPNLLPFANKAQQKESKDSVIEVDSEDEVIEHEPITGDINITKKKQTVKPSPKALSQQDKVPSDASKSEPIITEKDFDKFARRNSITCENYLTVNFDSKQPHTVVQTVVEKETNSKNVTRNDAGRIDDKTKNPCALQKLPSSTQGVKNHSISKITPVADDASSRNQSKLQKAYYSALTEKRQLASDYPITIIEDKPVKVVFVDNTEYAPTELNVQGQDLSPVKTTISDTDINTGTHDSQEVDLQDTNDDVKSQDDYKTKTKHQRKQVLTPVEEPELELIEPRDLGIEFSPKKKRRVDEDKADKNIKYPMRKKYLLGSSTVKEDNITNPNQIMRSSLNDNCVPISNPVSALDSLVKAAELIETQTEKMNNSLTSNSDSQPNTPVKRGRGRPRKYPLTPDGTVDKSKVTVPSPQKRPRLIDAKPPKKDVSTDESDSDDEMIKENWTMGKINENIVCPICNKLFRTENVVFKHVKHCTGPSPNRSDSDNRSPRRMRIDSDSKSQDSISDDMDIDDDKPLITQKVSSKKRKSKDSRTKSTEKDEIIVIEDTPVKEKPEKSEERKTHVSRKSTTKIPFKTNNLVCEFCGKTFRQLSYLVSHKLQHKKAEKPEKTDLSKTEKNETIPEKLVYSCEVCRKEFRKLHHLVQHRIIHNPTTAPSRPSRKNSLEQPESKVEKEPKSTKQSEDPSAGFRCEPCDKSFRKLHHLVEHRETHDGINRQKICTLPPNKEEKSVNKEEKPVVLHQCDVCKKTFKKLSQLNEHKEQHAETSSEKSDDKSVKSSLSTKDIIHECSLCYMVFPNEHSLNKHTVICQRKKRQSKQPKPTDETEESDDIVECLTPEENIETIDSPEAEGNEISKDDEKQTAVQNVEDKPPEKESFDTVKEKPVEVIKIDEPQKKLIEQEVKPAESQVIQERSSPKREFAAIESTKKSVTPDVPEKNKKVENKQPTKNHETPKKTLLIKNKSAGAMKRIKTPAPSATVTTESKLTVESSDDDEVRYMLNPNFKVEEVTEEKVFMKVRAKKRSSLQIERPDSKDLMKRRTSLQHPPKIPRLKSKSLETNIAVKKEVKTLKEEPLPATDSDDSETTKYSFPTTIPVTSTKPTQTRTPIDSERKIPKKTIVDKHKTLSGIAKRKSLGKAVTARHKLTPLKQVKKRTLEVEHRCDCGQLFSSAALLSRHTTLAHTPPRIRRRRSPPPDEHPPTKDTKLPRKSTAAQNTKQVASRKSSVRASGVKSPPRKADKTQKTPHDAKKAKGDKSEEASAKPRRTVPHRGVPVPDKMKKLIGKMK